MCWGHCDYEKRGKVFGSQSPRCVYRNSAVKLVQTLQHFLDRSTHLKAVPINVTQICVCTRRKQAMILVAGGEKSFITSLNCVASRSLCMFVVG
jgi:hypothetical protein